MEEVHETAEEERRHAEKRLKRKIDDLRSVIKHLDPPVGTSAPWSQVKHRISHTEEYLSLPTEADREAAFDKHIRRLQEKKQQRRDRELSESTDVHRRRRNSDETTPTDLPRRSRKKTKLSNGDDEVAGTTAADDVSEEGEIAE